MQEILPEQDKVAESPSLIFDTQLDTALKNLLCLSLLGLNLQRYFWASTTLVIFGFLFRTKIHEVAENTNKVALFCVEWDEEDEINSDLIDDS